MHNIYFNTITSDVGYVQKILKIKIPFQIFFLPLQMHVQNHERVQNFCFYPFRKKLKENPGTQWFHSLVVHLLLISFRHVWFPAIFCSLLTFISYSHPVFVIVVFVFLVPKITLVYITFFFPISILKVFLCTHALVFDVFCVLVRWIRY